MQPSCRKLARCHHPLRSFFVTSFVFFIFFLSYRPASVYTSEYIFTLWADIHRYKHWVDNVAHEYVWNHKSPTLENKGALFCNLAEPSSKFSASKRANLDFPLVGKEYHSMLFCEGAVNMFFKYLKWLYWLYYCRERYTNSFSAFASQWHCAPSSDGSV